MSTGLKLKIIAFSILSGLMSACTKLPVGGFGPKKALSKFSDTDTDTVQYKSVRIDPESLAITVGSNSSLIAYGKLANDTEKEITEDGVWSVVGTAAVASDAEGSKGQVEGVSIGSAVVKFTLKDLSAEATVEVTAPTIESLVVRPEDTSLPLGTRGTFTAEATLSDGTTKDVTEEVVWTTGSLNTIAESITDEKGKVLAKALGNDTVIATAENGVTAQVSIDVTGADLVSISIVAENV